MFDFLDQNISKKNFEIRCLERNYLSKFIMIYDDHLKLNYQRRFQIYLINWVNRQNIHKSKYISMIIDKAY
jgi:hypothetical protein